MSRRLLRASGRGLALPAACVLAAAACATLVPDCAKPARWSASDRPQHMDAWMLLDSRDPAVVFRSMHPSEVADIPQPTHFRPCCAFGADLHVRIGFVHIPGLKLPNVLGPDQLGHHYYDNGLVQTGATFDDSGRVQTERNGLVYTCRGGFIDVAHVRNWVDWTTFLATTIARHLETGTLIDLPSKGATLSARIGATEPEAIQRTGRLHSTLPLAQWIAFQLSVWDEITTWFGWSHLALFLERSSAFSPEDLYSNVIGIKIMAAIVAQGADRTEVLFNDSVDHWLGEILQELEAVDQELGQQAARAVEGLWWDPRRTVTDAALVQRRNMDVEMPLVPWLVPRDRMPEALRAACGDAPAPVPIGILERDQDGRPLHERAGLVIEVSDAIAAQEPFRSMQRPFTQDAFPEIIDYIRADARARFGPQAGDRNEGAR
jgi:hypothetical protein